jgi:hypothetical protein
MPYLPYFHIHPPPMSEQITPSPLHHTESRFSGAGSIYIPTETEPNKPKLQYQYQHKKTVPNAQTKLSKRKRVRATHTTHTQETNIPRQGKISSTQPARKPAPQRELPLPSAAG